MATQADTKELDFRKQLAEIDEALALLNQQEKALTKIPRDFVQDQTNTELIAIGMDELGIARDAA